MKYNKLAITTKLKKDEESLQRLKDQFLNGNEKEAIDRLENEIFGNLSNLTLVKVYLELLQIGNSKAVFERFTLDEIESVYLKLISICPYDLDLNFEYYYFLKNVMDKEKESQSFLEQYQKKILKKFKTVLTSDK